MKYSVGKIARMFGISRTTLLYYDNIGLLSPSERSEAGYRLYNNDDIEKLSRIKLFKDAGLPLNEVPKLLENGEKNNIAAALMKQLNELNREIIAIKERQEVIVKILMSEKVAESIHELDKTAGTIYSQMPGLVLKSLASFMRTLRVIRPSSTNNFLRLLA